MSEEQAVVSEDAVAEPTVDNGDAQDLDSLLSEFESETETQANQAQPAGEQQSSDDYAERIKALETRIEQEEYQSDMSNVVKEIRGESDFDDDFMEAWIDTQARKDERLRVAWANRKSNPQAFNKVIKSLGSKFRDKYTNPIVEDTSAMVNAVRNASNQAPATEMPNLNQMSDAEFARFKAGLK